jgi:blocked-early-in-transport protein 1
VRGHAIYLTQRAVVQAGAASHESYMEQESDASIALLADKVRALKGIAIDIGAHVRDDNRLLDGLDNGFDSAGGLLGGTMKRLNALASSKDGNHMLYLALFVVGIFLFIYKMR